MNLDELLTPSLPFTWRDALTQGSTGIVSQPSEEQVENIKLLAQQLVPILALVGPCSVNSWLRTPEHNHDVGGAAHSSHLVGSAVDLHPHNHSVAECKQLIKDSTPQTLFFEINTTTWLHLDNRHDHNFIA